MPLGHFLGAEGFHGHLLSGLEPIDDVLQLRLRSQVDVPSFALSNLKHDVDAAGSAARRVFAGARFDGYQLSFEGRSFHVCRLPCDAAGLSHSPLSKHTGCGQNGSECTNTQ
jgi:hypothetical protein